MTESWDQFIGEVSLGLEESASLCFMCRATDLQSAEVNRLKDVKSRVLSVKAEKIAQRDEEAANMLLSIENMVDLLVSELRMYISLKEDNPIAAWDHLVDAQTAARMAIQAHSIGAKLEGYTKRLHALEHLLFPPQMFMSVGTVGGCSVCSICGDVYGECNHLAGKPYLGQLCARIVKDAHLTEVSLVDEPANKHARIYSVNNRDTLSGRIATSANKDEKI
jgi:hypothetical protein